MFAILSRLNNSPFLLILVSYAASALTLEVAQIGAVQRAFIHGRWYWEYNGIFMPLLFLVAYVMEKRWCFSWRCWIFPPLLYASTGYLLGHVSMCAASIVHFRGVERILTLFIREGWATLWPPFLSFSWLYGLVLGLAIVLIRKAAEEMAAATK